MSRIPMRVFHLKYLKLQLHCHLVANQYGTLIRVIRALYGYVNVYGSARRAGGARYVVYYTLLASS